MFKLHYCLITLLQPLQIQNGNKHLGAYTFHFHWVHHRFNSSYIPATT